MACDEPVFESSCTSIGDELAFGNKLLDCFHPVSHMHDRHNKDEVSSVEEYCDIIAEMTISHYPKMLTVSRKLSGVEFPTLNKAAHDVKSGCWKTS